MASACRMTSVLTVCARLPCPGTCSMFDLLWNAALSPEKKVNPVRSPLATRRTLTAGSARCTRATTTRTPHVWVRSTAGQYSPGCAAS